MSKYKNEYHQYVAMADFGIYNWKQHSTGYVLKMYRELRHYSHSYGYGREYWLHQWALRLQDELAKRPHLSNKRERRKQRKK